MKKTSEKIEFAGYVHPPLPDLAKYQVGTKAQEDAFRGQEFRDGTLPDTLSRIKNTLEEFLAKEVIYYQKILHVLQGRADEKKSDLDKNNIIALFGEKIIKFPRLVISKIKADLEHKEAVFHQSNDGFLKFKKFHDRALMPMRATPTFWSIYGLLGFLFFVEASVNAVFFAGIVGGLVASTLSIAQAFINISTCFIIGKMVIGGAFFSRTLQKRLVYWAIFVTQLFMMIWMNLMLGLYRALNQSQTAILTDPEILQQALVPFRHLGEFNVDSALVACVGFVLAMISYMKGYFSDDPYPGYGARYRQAIRARDAVSQEVQKIHENVADAKEEVAAAITDVKKELEPSIKDRSQSVNTIEKCFIDYEQLLQMITSAYENQCDLYETNYAQASTTGGISVSRDILTARDRDSAITFQDAFEYHISDSDRLVLIEKEKNQFNEDYKIIQTEWSDRIRQFEQDSNEICRHYPAMAVGVIPP